MPAGHPLFLALLSLVVICSGVVTAKANSCGDPFVLDPQSLPIVEVGSTIGAGNDDAGSCVLGSDNAPEVVFEFTPSTSDDYTFSTDNPGTNFDTGIYVREICADAFSEITCTDEPGGESLTFFAQAGTTYYLFVDGAGSDEGDFELTLILGGPPPVSVPMLSWKGTALLMLLLVGVGMMLSRCVGASSFPEGRSTT